MFKTSSTFSIVPNACSWLDLSPLFPCESVGFKQTAGIDLLAPRSPQRIRNSLQQVAFPCRRPILSTTSKAGPYRILQYLTSVYTCGNWWMRVFCVWKIFNQNGGRFLKLGMLVKIQSRTIMFLFGMTHYGGRVLPTCADLISRFSKDTWTV